MPMPVCLVGVLICTLVATAAEPYPRTASGEVDLKALVQGMSFDEKVGQLTQILSGKANAPASSESNGEAFDEEFLSRVHAGGIGALIGACGMERFNRIQREAVENSRLGIPLLVGHDMIHGCNVGLPIPLASSCAFDDDLWRRIAESTALNGRSRGCHWAFAPMVDVARDARWGRIAEGAGQDPTVTRRFAVAQVRGYQGDDPADGRHLAACLKHYVGYGAAIAGRDYNDVEMGETTLREIYLPPFRAGVEAGALTVMPAFHGLNGVPCSANRWLLTDILRGEFGFRGFTISDWGAVNQCGPGGHAVTDGPVQTACAALGAGMDMEMVSDDYRNGLRKGVRDGFVTEAEIDRAVSRVLWVKRALGLFDHPYFDIERINAGLDEEADFRLAREAAAKSVVLLKNAHGVLPLEPGLRVAVVGDIADRREEMQGCWSSFCYRWRSGSLVEGLKANGVNVEYSSCYTLTGAVDVAALNAAAAGADVVVAAFGEYYGMSGENTSRANITLPGRQLEVLRALKTTGRPLVAVLFNGRPLAIPELAAEADAIVEAWFLGSSAGLGIADVMTGATEPWGRLTVDFPTCTGECPKFYNRSPTGRPHNPASRWTTMYLDAPDRSVYPFGHGLAYTTFAYANATASVRDGKVTLSCTVTNTGKRKGSELVQAYTRALNARRIQPRRALKDWRRVELAPGESKTVEITLDAAALGWFEDSRFVTGHGRYEAWLAPNSDQGERLAFAL